MIRSLSRWKHHALSLNLTSRSLATAAPYQGESRHDYQELGRTIYLDPEWLTLIYLGYWLIVAPLVLRIYVDQVQGDDK